MFNFIGGGVARIGNDIWSLHFVIKIPRHYLRFVLILVIVRPDLLLEVLGVRGVQLHVLIVLTPNLIPDMRK